MRMKILSGIFCLIGFCGDIYPASINQMLKKGGAYIKIEEDRAVNSPNAELSAMGYLLIAENGVDKDLRKKQVVSKLVCLEKGSMYRFYLTDSFFMRRLQIYYPVSDKRQGVFLVMNLVEQGDSITISRKNGVFSFKGNNAEKYKCEYELEILKQSVYDNGYRYTVGNPDLPASAILDQFSLLDTKTKILFSHLDKYKSQLSKKIYALLKADILAFQQWKKIAFIDKIGSGATWFYKSRVDSCKNILEKYSDPIWSGQLKAEMLSNEMLLNCEAFVQVLLAQFQIENWTKQDYDFDVKGAYNYFSKISSGTAREWLIYSLVKTYLMSRDVHYCITNALQSGYIQNADIKNYFEDIANSLVAGNLAFNFHLPDVTGNIVKLSDFAGKVVLMDFWYSSCGACARLHPFLDSATDKIKDTNFVLLSICLADYRTNSVEQWMPWIKKGIFTRPSNINLFAKSSYANGDWDGIEIAKNYKLKGAPTLILIDKSGKLAEPPPTPEIEGGVPFVNHIQRLLAN